MGPQKEKEVKNLLILVSQVGSFGFVMGISILIGYYLGSYLDRKLDTYPWFMLIFILLFMVGAFVEFIQTTRKINELGTKQKKDKNQV